MGQESTWDGFPRIRRGSKLEWCHSPSQQPSHNSLIIPEKSHQPHPRCTGKYGPGPTSCSMQRGGANIIMRINNKRRRSVSSLFGFTNVLPLLFAKRTTINACISKQPKSEVATLKNITCRMSSVEKLCYPLLSPDGISFRTICVMHFL